MAVLDPFDDSLENSSNSSVREAIFNMDDKTFNESFAEASRKFNEETNDEYDNSDSDNIDDLHSNYEENVEEPLDNLATEEVSEPKEKYEEVDEEETITIRADGEEYTLTLDELKGLASKGINYTKKLQKVQPFRKMVGMLEDSGISEAELNQFIEMREGNKVALANFIANKQITLDDIENQSNDDIMNYIAKDYGREITPFTEKVDELKGRTNYNKLVDYVNSLDDVSKRGIIENPTALDILISDMDRGIFDEIYRDAEKRRLVSSDNRPMLDYYVSAANSHLDKLSAKQETSRVLKSKAPAKGDKSKVRVTGNVSPKARNFKVVNEISDIDEEDFKEFMKEIENKRR